MRLVRRLRGSTVVEAAPARGPTAPAPDSAEGSVLPLANHKDAPFAKIFTATKQQILDILERDRKEIQDQIMAEIDTSEIIYLEQALEMLKTKEEKINRLYTEPTDDISEETVQVIYEKPTICDKKVDWFDVTDEASGVEVIEKEVAALDLHGLNPDAEEFHLPTTEAKDIECDSNDVAFPLTECPIDDETSEEARFEDIDKQNQAKYFYFYQAEDGQQVFLNRLNVRMLNACWGSLVVAPAVIHGRVLHRDTHFLTEDTRTHMPCTAHLPLNCAFDIVEMDLKPPHVTVEVLRSYTDELERRAKKRAKQEQEERRRERAYRRAMEGPPKPDISSEVLFPSTYGSPPLHEPIFESPSTSASPPMEQSPSGLSFAKMASASGTWRVRKSPAAPTVVAAPSEEEGSGPRSLVLGEAIEAALHATAPPSTSSKKKKFKKLFTTDMQRAS